MDWGATLVGYSMFPAADPMNSALSLIVTLILFYQCLPLVHVDYTI